MANKEIEDVISQFDKAHVSGQEHGELSFAGQGLKLDNENDGEFLC